MVPEVRLVKIPLKPVVSGLPDGLIQRAA